MKKGVDFIGVTCVFFCHDGKGNLLMHKRSKNCKDEQGNWDVGGGALEMGEEWEDCVRREVKEEYCTDILDLHFAAVTNVLRENNGVKTHWIALTFAVLVDPKQVKIGEPEKMDDIGWFSKNNWPSPLHSQTPRHYALVKQFIEP